MLGDFVFVKPIRFVHHIPVLKIDKSVWSLLCNNTNGFKCPLRTRCNIVFLIRVNYRFFGQPISVLALPILPILFTYCCHTLSVSLWRCVLWRNDTSYSKKRKCPHRNTMDGTVTTFNLLHWPGALKLPTLKISNSVRSAISATAGLLVSVSFQSYLCSKLNLVQHSMICDTFWTNKWWWWWLLLLLLLLLLF